MVNYTESNLSLHFILLSGMACIQPSACAYRHIRLEFIFRSFNFVISFAGSFRVSESLSTLGAVDRSTSETA